MKNLSLSRWQAKRFQDEIEMAGEVYVLTRPSGKKQIVAARDIQKFTRWKKQETEPFKPHFPENPFPRVEYREAKGRGRVSEFAQVAFITAAYMAFCLWFFNYVLTLGS